MRYAVTSTLVPSVELLDFFLLEEAAAPFVAELSVAALLPAELADDALWALCADEALAASVLALLNAAISASTMAICEDTICSSVALAPDFEASSAASSFSYAFSCFSSVAICELLLLELLEPTAETTMLFPCGVGRHDVRPRVI